MRKLDVHQSGRRLKSVVKKIKNSEIPKKDKKLIFEFYDFALSTGLSNKRIIKYLHMLSKISEMSDSCLEDCEKEGIARIVRQIEMKDFSAWTKKDYKIVIKRFYKWLNGDNEYPEKVKWIKTTFKKNDNKLPDELITHEEVNRMIKSANNTRDRALISVLYESGFRISEILTLRIRNISFDKFGGKITCNDEKTGMRRIRLVHSIPYLSAWLHNHPFNNDNEAALWIKHNADGKDDIILYQRARKIVKSLAKRAGIKKNIHPHLFRHSRATELANHFTEAQMNQYFGWVQGSDMPGTYVHLSGRDLDGKILEINGFKNEIDQEKKKETAIKCPRCENITPSTSKFCIKCGMAINELSAIGIDEKRKRMDDMMSKLMKDPETQRFMLNKMRQMRMESPMTS